MEDYIKYEMIIYCSKEDNAFIVEVPELPGCMADGKTYEEAIKNALVVIREWYRNRKGTGKRNPGT
jgi:predicted RNase H-like HicB family nuclease